MVLQFMMYALTLIEVLFKLKPSTTKEQISELKEAAKNMVGKVPGETSLRYHESCADSE